MLVWKVRVALRILVPASSQSVQIEIREVFRGTYSKHETPRIASGDIVIAHDKEKLEAFASQP